MVASPSIPHCSSIVVSDCDGLFPGAVSQIAILTHLDGRGSGGLGVATISDVDSNTNSRRGTGCALAIDTDRVRLKACRVCLYASLFRVNEG